MEKAENPFLIRGYESKELFCDREKEVNELVQNAVNKVDTTLLSPRRMGKTGLIFRFMEEIRKYKDIEAVYVDIYSSRNLDDFIKLLTEAVLAKFPERSSVGKRFLLFLKGLRPLVSYDALTGLPQVQFVYQTVGEKESTLKGLLDFLEHQPVRIVVAIDEFQQIAAYPEVNMEALLRTYIQPLQHLRFIFSGSGRTLMLEMFGSSKRPFFASTRNLVLEKIDVAVYAAFIRRLFGKYKREVEDEALEMIMQWTKGYTFYTQNLCNRIFAFGDKKITIASVKFACNDLLKCNEPVFYQYRQLLTPGQWNFLIAVAKEESVRQITAQQFLARYRIGTPANARRLVDALVQKELILETNDEQGCLYQVYDVFLSRWLQREY